MFEAVIFALSTLLNRVLVFLGRATNLPAVFLAISMSFIRRDGNAYFSLRWMLSVNQAWIARALTRRPPQPPPPPGTLKLFAWELSYFSGKVRAYLRFKSRTSGVKFEETVASPDVIADLLLPATGSSAVPQVQFPDGRIVQDSKLVMESVEALWPEPSWSGAGAKRRLAGHLIELLADEWLLVPAFHWRWAYSGDGSARQRMPTFMGGVRPAPSHREFNERQWGAFLRPGEGAETQRAAGKFLMDTFLLTDFGIKGAIASLGVSERTVAAWEASCRNILALFQVHLRGHSFVFGEVPSTADFALLGPIYAHLYRDPVPGAMLRAEFPLVADWCERLHDRGGEPRSSGAASKSKSNDDDEDDGDAIPSTLIPLLQVFFDEMWPALKSSCAAVANYTRGKAGVVLPGKSFHPESLDQAEFGPLTYPFSLPFGPTGASGERPPDLGSGSDSGSGRGGGGNRGSEVSFGRRMVVPHQLWMLQRVEATLLPGRSAPLSPGNGDGGGAGDQPPHHPALPLLALLRGGPELLGLSGLLDAGARVRRDQLGRLVSV